MREILFRARRKDNGEWVYGSLIGKDVIVGPIIEFNDEYFNTEFWWKANPETVGQYTGLKDCNGTNIFVGDILKWTSWKKDSSDNALTFNNAVEFYAGGTLCGYRIRRKSFMKPLTRNRIFNAGAIVVGNIHQNPELLTP